MGLVDYLKETRTELKHVSWATRKQAINFTGLVIGVSLLVAILLGAFDSLFGLALEAVLSNRAPSAEIIPNQNATTTTATSTTNNPLINISTSTKTGTPTQPKK